MTIPTSSTAGMKMKCPAVTTSYRPRHPLCLAHLSLDAPETPPQHQHVQQQRAPHDDIGPDEERRGRQFLAVRELVDRDVLVLGSGGRRGLRRLRGLCARGRCGGGDEQQQEGTRAGDAIQKGHS